jgi:hypothetical protein
VLLHGWDQLNAHYSSARVEALAASGSLITIPELQLPSGWSKQTSMIRFLAPVAFPAAQPDCFWADTDLLLANGAPPSNSGIQVIPETSVQGLWFSWHLSSWSPAHDDLLTYVRFIQKRFVDAR